MVKYIIKRLLMMIPIILAVTVIIFTLMNFVPGDPATIQASGQVLTEEQLDAIRESMGLNQPFLTRLFNYIKNVFLHLDFGLSYTNGSPVGPELLTRFWTTFRIAVIGMVLMILIGVPLGSQGEHDRGPRFHVRDAHRQLHAAFLARADARAAVFAEAEVAAELRLG